MSKGEMPGAAPSYRENALSLLRSFGPSKVRNVTGHIFKIGPMPGMGGSCMSSAYFLFYAGHEPFFCHAGHRRAERLRTSPSLVASCAALGVSWPARRFFHAGSIFGHGRQGRRHHG